MSKLQLNINEYVRDAFYALPAFADVEGNYVSGIYGALYKLLGEIRGGEYKFIELVGNAKAEEDGTNGEDAFCTIPAVEEQVVRFGNIINPDGKKEIEISDEFIKKLEEELSKLSPSETAAKAVTFNAVIKVTSDLNEVENIFNTKAEFGSFFFLLDNISSEGTKRKDVVGLSLCFDDKNVFYIPIENFITADYLGKKLSELSKRCSLATFDIKPGYYYFEPYEISNRTKGYVAFDKTYEYRCFDALIGAYLVNPLKNDYQIEDIAKEYLGLSLMKKSDIFGKESLKNSEEKKLSDYAGKVAEIIFRATPVIKKKLEKLQMEKLFYEIEMPLSYILFAMEKEGIIARRDELKVYGDKLQVRIEELEKAIYEAAGCEFNINSPKQLGEILFEKLGLPAEKKTKSGYSTAAEVLEKLAPEHKIVADILEYRGLAKLKSTYADGLTNYIEADNRIHTSFNQTITATGRISSTEPNLQNIPMRTELGRLIRKVFVPKEGYVFADADYSQVELRILAHMSQDKELIKAFNDGDDIHTITASKVFHVPFEEVTPIQRRSAKAVNFGIVYGISAFGLSQDLGISAHEAKDYMDKYFDTYPGVKGYQESVISNAKAKGYSETMFGRRRPMPELKASNFNMRQFGERVAMNAPIQGTAADIMKIAMINVFFKLKELGLKSKLILQIHDELVIETAMDEVEQVTALLTAEMEKSADLLVPLLADCHTGSDWYEAK